MPRPVQVTVSLVLPLVVCFALATAASLAFSYVAEGDPLPDLKLPDAQGQLHSFQGSPENSARVFAFVKGGHERSTELVAHLNRLQEEFGGRAVSWTLIVSDRHGTAWADSVALLAPEMLLLIDQEDKLYGTLGVALTPSVGIGTGQGTLHTYLPYRKVHYQAIIAAQVGYLLGDIDAEELAQVMQPSGQARDTAEMGAQRKLKLGRMLLERGKLDPAQQQAEDVLAEFPDLADAYLLLAEIFEARGEPGQAAAVRQRAASLSSGD